MKDWNQVLKEKDGRSRVSCAWAISAREGGPSTLTTQLKQSAVADITWLLQIHALVTHPCSSARECDHHRYSVESLCGSYMIDQELTLNAWTVNAHDCLHCSPATLSE